MEFTEPVGVQGHQMVLDPQDSLELKKNGVYESYVSTFMAEQITPKMTCVDIGAHIGYHTLLMARQAACVHAFEPHIANRRLLRENVRINGYSNVLIYDKALSNKRGRESLYLCNNNSGGHRLVKPYLKRDGGQMLVQTTTFDYVLDHGDFLKIDAEGHEYHILLGAKRLLEQGAPLGIVMEFWPTEIRRMGLDPLDALHWLVALGFQLHQFVSVRDGPVIPATIEEIMRFEPSGGWVYLWVHRP